MEALLGLWTLLFVWLLSEAQNGHTETRVPLDLLSLLHRCVWRGGLLPGLHRQPVIILTILFALGLIGLAHRCVSSVCLLREHKLFRFKWTYRWFLDCLQLAAGDCLDAPVLKVKRSNFYNLGLTAYRGAYWLVQAYLCYVNKNSLTR